MDLFSLGPRQLPLLPWLWDGPDCLLLFNIRGSSAVRIANRFSYCTRTSGVQDLPSSKRRSRGPVMAAKKGSGGMCLKYLNLLFAFVSNM